MPNFRTLALIFAALVFCARVGAQSMGLLVTASPNPVVVSNSLTLTVTVSNQTAGTLQNVTVTNIPFPKAQFVSAFPTNSYKQTTNNLTFYLGALNAGSVTQMTLTMLPLSVGFETNFFSAGSSSVADVESTNVITQVINTNPVADLGVAMGGFPADIFVNDRVTYQVSVTNFGPNSVTNVILSNGIPPGVELLGVSPTNQTFSTATNFVVMNLGKLTNGASKNIQFTVQPTNSGVFTFSAFVGSADLIDTNLANNSVSSDITVQEFTGTLIATNVSAMQFDPQTGLMNQTINLSNIGTNSVPSARVIVSGLTNLLFNAVGTNNGSPFVVYGNTLDTNQSVNLVLEYFVPTRLPITVSNSQYTAVGVETTNSLTPVGTNGTFVITKQFHFSNGNFLIEFQSVPGSIYTIYYSDDMVTWFAAQPSITAQADRTQWIDDGPPKTSSVVNPSRMYRVFLNP